MEHGTESARMTNQDTGAVVRPYEPPLMVEAGAYAEVTRGSVGNIREPYIGRWDSKSGGGQLTGTAG